MRKTKQFKVRTCQSVSLNRQDADQWIENLKQKADKIADQDSEVDLSSLHVGEACLVFGIDYDRSKAVLNHYKRIK